MSKPAFENFGKERRIQLLLAVVEDVEPSAQLDPEWRLAVVRIREEPREEILRRCTRLPQKPSLLSNCLVTRTPNRRGSVRNMLVVKSVSSLFRNVPVIAVTLNTFFTYPITCQPLALVRISDRLVVEYGMDLVDRILEHARPLLRLPVEISMQRRRPILRHRHCVFGANDVVKCGAFGSWFPLRFLSKPWPLFGAVSGLKPGY